MNILVSNLKCPLHIGILFKCVEGVLVFTKPVHLVAYRLLVLLNLDFILFLYFLHLLSFPLKFPLHIAVIDTSLFVFVKLFFLVYDVALKVVRLLLPDDA